MLLITPNGWAANSGPHPPLLASDTLAHSEIKNFPPESKPVTDTVTFWPFLRFREGVTVTLGSEAYSAGTRPDFDVVVVSAGFRVVVVTGVVVVGAELAGFDEQPVRTTGSTATIRVDHFLESLIELQCPFANPSGEASVRAKLRSTHNSNPTWRSPSAAAPQARLGGPARWINFLGFHQYDLCWGYSIASAGRYWLWHYC